MLTPYQSEELENIRRAAELGKSDCEDPWFGSMVHLDLFVYIIDLVTRIRNNNGNA